MALRTQPSTSGPRVGIAISPTGLSVASRGRAGVSSRPGITRFALEPMSGDNGAVWPSLADALREVARASGAAGGLDIALLAPLVEVRRLELPPLQGDALRQLLTRNSARYFVGARGPQVTGAVTPVRKAKEAATGVVAAAAAARLVTAIYGAARDAGWTVESLAPAEGAWALAALELWPKGAWHGAALLVLHDAHTDLLQVEDGRVAALRRFRAGAADEAFIAEAIGSAAGTRIAAVGAAAPRLALATALQRRGISLLPPPDEWAAIADNPDALAAAFTGPRAEPRLESDDARASREVRGRRTVTRALAGAAALLVLAALLELWGAYRELGALERQRAELRAQVTATLVGRTSVETAFRQLAALNTSQRSAARWSVVLSAIGQQLPEDAYLTAFRGRGDSVIVDGLAKHAARAFDAMERTTGLVNVRAAAPVRREAPSGGPAMEHFTIAARLGTTAAPQAHSVARAPQPGGAAPPVPVTTGRPQ
jgi:hypothetical protein